MAVNSNHVTYARIRIAPGAGLDSGASSVAGAGDLGELYGLLSRRLEQIVRSYVRAPDVVVEDACQFAWSRLVYHRDRVQRETVMSWLARTAVHEALKLLRRERRDSSLEAVSEAGALPASAGATPAPDDLVERRDRLVGLSRLPERQQRALWLHALGLSYAEIAVHEGCTVRTVERQLLRGRQRLRSEAAPVPPCRPAPAQHDKRRDLGRP